MTQEDEEVAVFADEVRFPPLFPILCPSLLREPLSSRRLKACLTKLWTDSVRDRRREGFSQLSFSFSFSFFSGREEPILGDMRNPDFSFILKMLLIDKDFCYK